MLNRLSLMTSSLWPGAGPGLAEASRQVRQVVVGKALQAGAAGLHPHQ